MTHRASPRPTLAGLGRFVLRHLVFNIQAAMEYRVSFVLQVLLMITNDLLLLVFWWILFGRIPSIGGWTSSDTMLLIGLAAGSFGLSATLTGNVFRLSRLIADGQMDVYLLYPKDPLVHALVGRTMVSGIGDLLFAVVVIGLLGPEGWGSRLMLAWAIVMGAVVFTAAGVIAHALTFHLGRAAGVASFVHEAILALGMYPESIYPPQVRALLYTLIPVGFVVFVPAHLLRHPDPWLLCGTSAFALLMARLAWRVFGAGLARYQSGNLIAARL